MVEITNLSGVLPYCRFVPIWKNRNCFKVYAGQKYQGGTQSHLGSWQRKEEKAAEYGLDYKDGKLTEAFFQAHWKLFRECKACGNVQTKLDLPKFESLGINYSQAVWHCKGRMHWVNIWNGSRIHMASSMERLKPTTWASTSNNNMSSGSGR